ncbi:hypothetical protein D3C81_1884370 [compost metagenome]
MSFAHQLPFFPVFFGIKNDVHIVILRIQLFLLDVRLQPFAVDFDPLSLNHDLDDSSGIGKLANDANTP